MAKSWIITTAKILAIPAAIGGYITVSGLTGFCPTCEAIVSGVSGKGGGGCRLKQQTTIPESPIPVATSSAGVPAATLDGVATNLASLDTSERPMIVEVWATYCSPCGTQRDTLAKMSAELKDSTAIVGLAADSAERVNDYLAAHGNVFETELLATPGTIQSLGGITTIPTLVFISSDGDIASITTGVQSPEMIRAELAKID